MVAPVANSQSTADQEKLHSLYPLKTGKPIEKVSKTSKDIAELGRMSIISRITRVVGSQANVGLSSLLLTDLWRIECCRW